MPVLPKIILTKTWEPWVPNDLDVPLLLNTHCPGKPVSRSLISGPRIQDQNYCWRGNRWKSSKVHMYGTLLEYDSSHLWLSTCFFFFLLESNAFLHVFTPSFLPQGPSIFFVFFELQSQSCQFNLLACLEAKGKNKHTRNPQNCCNNRTNKSAGQGGKERGQVLAEQVLLLCCGDNHLRGFQAQRNVCS